jgi:hypothetical protein
VGTAATGNGINATGGGGAHNNLQPYLVTNYIIKFTSAFVSTDSELAARIGAQETLNATTNRAGMVPIVPSGMNYGSGSGSISSNGLITFTNASFLAPNGCFTSTYNRYRVILDIQSCSVNDYVYWRGVAAATGNAVSTNSYNTGSVYQQSGGVMAYDNGNTTQTYSRIGYVTNDDGASYILDIFNPFQTRKTKGHFVSQYSASGLTNLTGAFTLNATTSLSGILFAPYNGANGNWTGTLRIFGVL